MNRLARFVVVAVAEVVVVAGCSSKPGVANPNGSAIGPLSLAKDEHMVLIPAGQYIAGSTHEERLAAYDDYMSTAGQDTAREKKWFEAEEDRHVAVLPAFRIDL